MTERIKWDHTYGYPLEVMPNIDEPWRILRVNSEGERPDSNTEWLDAVEEYPDEYLPDFPELLGPPVYILEDGIVRKTYPHAEYTEESLRAILEDRTDMLLEAALKPTDYYVIRRMELGIEIPESVVEDRAYVRMMAEEYKEQARTAPAHVLPTLNWRLKNTKPDRKWKGISVDRRESP